MTFFTEIGKASYMSYGITKDPGYQTTLHKYWRDCYTRLRAILQIYVNKTSMVLTQKCHVDQGNKI